MAKVTDLYAILRAYSHKIRSPYVDIGTFIAFLSKYVHHLAVEQPTWAEWIPEVSLKFWDALGAYTENGRCVLLTDSPEGRIYLPYYMVDRLKEAYHDLDAVADVPFPNEETFKVKLPQDQVLVVNLGYGLNAYFDEFSGSRIPIVKMIFPDQSMDALILGAMIPHILLEAAVFKIRNYFDQHNNKEYILHKLMPMLQGREGILRENVEMVVARPRDCLDSIERGGEIAYLFWASLCSLIKGDIHKKIDRFTSDIAVLEAVCVIEICLNYYRSRLQKERVKETALRCLDQNMDRAPYYFTQNQIIKFTDPKGTPLLNQYTPDDLNAHIKKMTTENVDGMLPEWLVVQTKNNEPYYLKKDRYLPLVARLILDAQGGMKQAILNRWTAMLNNFKSEPAMDNDAEFDRLLAGLNASSNPLLSGFLDDKKLYLVFDEVERVQKAVPVAFRIYERGRLLPYSQLFSLKRRELIFDAKMFLPFWYFIPVIRSIAAFFFKMGKKKNQKQQGARKAGGAEAAEAGVPAEQGKSQQKDFTTSVKEMETELVPENKDINSYLKELQRHWVMVLDPKAQQNLVEDVNSLVKDNLVKSLRVWKKQRLSTTQLEDLARGLLYGNQSLRTLTDQDSLLLYMEVYMVKLLKNIKSP
ncbi:MAG: hypothetical protein LBH51_01040 [Treponema sp.]|jgi:hypothetical protein|nr:hypothetical protein [Treponema sp.]